MDRKGIGVGQVFVYIIAIITFALIMIFSFKALFGFVANLQKVEFVQFKSDLENSIQQLHSEFGAIRQEEFFTPKHFQQICFIDLDYAPTSVEVSSLCDLDSIACNAWTDSSGFAMEEENVFLQPPAEVKIKVPRLELNQGFLCAPIRNGKFILILEGRGDRTKLSALS